MAEKDARAIAVNWLNEMLGLDHDWICEALAVELEVKSDSDMAMMTLVHEKGGLKYMTPLTLMSAAFGKPILPVFEDGIIQRFE